MGAVAGAQGCWKWWAASSCSELPVKPGTAAGCSCWSGHPSSLLALLLLRRKCRRRGGSGAMGTGQPPAGNCSAWLRDPGPHCPRSCRGDRQKVPGVSVRGRLRLRKAAGAVPLLPSCELHAAAGPPLTTLLKSAEHCHQAVDRHPPTDAVVWRQHRLLLLLLGLLLLLLLLLLGMLLLLLLLLLGLLPSPGSAASLAAVRSGLLLWPGWARGCCRQQGLSQDVGRRQERGGDWEWRNAVKTGR